MEKWHMIYEVVENRLTMGKDLNEIKSFWTEEEAETCIKDELPKGKYVIMEVFTKV